MKPEKEAEYIAEIVRLKSQLNKEHVTVGDESITTNSELLEAANKCIEQISFNTGNKAKIRLTEHKTMPLQTCIEERQYHLIAEVISVTKI